MYDSDIDVLHVSQTCRSWRKLCIEQNVFAHHEKELLLANELILSSTELDEEYALLEAEYGEIDNIEFYFYIKKRVRAAVNKTRLFKHNLHHAYLGNDLFFKN